MVKQLFCQLDRLIAHFATCLHLPTVPMAILDHHPSLFSVLLQSLPHTPSWRPSLYEQYHLCDVSPRTLVIGAVYCQMPSQAHAGWARAQLVEFRTMVSHMLTRLFSQSRLSSQ